MDKKYIILIGILLIIGFLLLDKCEDLDANCDGQINIVDMSIYLAKADMVTKWQQSNNVK